MPKSNKKIIISIIIPYYRKKNFLSSTIQSIKNQTYKHYEVILIYDDKNHNEIKFVKNCLKLIKNKKIIINQNNIGAGFSRNKGIKVAKGKYIAFCDSDDIWKKNKLKDQLLYMKKNNYDFTHTNYQIIDDNFKIKGSFKVKDKIYYDDLIKSCDIGLSSVICNRSLFKKNNFPSLKTKEDYSLWLKIIKHKKIFYGFNKNLSYWRQTKNSLSSSIFQRVLDAFKLYYIHQKFSLIKSCYFTLRLTIYALIKKMNIYLR
jgi:teichuronic acid biosynthesis glycosyltransferase TuaG